MKRFLFITILVCLLTFAAMYFFASNFMRGDSISKSEVLNIVLKDEQPCFYINLKDAEKYFIKRVGVSHLNNTILSISLANKPTPPSYPANTITTEAQCLRYGEAINNSNIKFEKLNFNVRYSGIVTVFDGSYSKPPIDFLSDFILTKDANGRVSLTTMPSP